MAMLEDENWPSLTTVVSGTAPQMHVVFLEDRLSGAKEGAVVDRIDQQFGPTSRKSRKLASVL